jgi:hypothetical protein
MRGKIYIQLGLCAILLGVMLSLLAYLFSRVGFSKETVTASTTVAPDYPRPLPTGFPRAKPGGSRGKARDEEDYEHDDSDGYIPPSPTFREFSPLTTLSIEIAFYQYERGQQEASEKTLEGINPDARDEAISEFVDRILMPRRARNPTSGEKRSDQEIQNLLTRQIDHVVRISEKVVDPVRRAQLLLKIATVSAKRGYSGADKVFEKSRIAAGEAETAKKKADEAETAKDKVDEGKKSDPSLVQAAEEARQYREMSEQLRKVRLEADLLAEQKRLEELGAQRKSWIWVAIGFCFTGLCAILLLIGKTAIEELTKKVVGSYLSIRRGGTSMPEGASG